MTLPWLEDTWNRFATRLEQGRLPHALLLAGPAGTGKGRLARDMIAGLLCLEGRAEACGTCRSCQLLAGGAHPDRFELFPEEGKREIKVDQVRALLEPMGFTATISPRKAALIEPAEAMNRAAANALLKNLEEPPGETVLLLVSHDPSRLLATIRSRCQLLPVPLPRREAAVEWLGSQDGFDARRADLALEAAGGSPLAARALAEEDLLEPFEAVLAELEAIVGKPSRSGVLAGRLQTLPGEVAWAWLSLAAARALGGRLGVRTPPWPATDYQLPEAKLAALQAKADHHRKLLASTVRQDLLLREWLLEWARLPAPEPIR